MRFIPIVALLIAGTATTGCAAQTQQQREVGVETTIPYANGGIRNWESGPADSNIVYVQDRRLYWYKIELTGPCIDTDVGPMTVQYTTNVAGSLDTFSKLTFPDYAGRTCGIKRITTSLPPPGQPGAPEPSAED